MSEKNCDEGDGILDFETKTLESDILWIFIFALPLDRKQPVSLVQNYVNELLYREKADKDFPPVGTECTL